MYSAAEQAVLARVGYEQVLVSIVAAVLVVLYCCVTAGGAAPAGQARAPYKYGGDEKAQGLGVWISSPRMGLMFVDGEKLDVSAKVIGATGPVTVEFVLEDLAGPHKQTGKVTISRPNDQQALPLTVPGRGLYKLTLSAVAGNASAKAESNVAVLFPPAAASESSQWGVFYYQPHELRAEYPDELRDSVTSMRMMGASWVRLNFWASSFGKVTVKGGDKPQADADYAYWKQVVKELRKQGLFIMGEVAQCPRELSSKADQEAGNGDAGPLWCRVKPADYRQWDDLMEKLAAQFRDEIPAWEIWNEPDMPGKYWAGTPQEFIELIQHTAVALRKGNPKAKIIAGGFTGATPFVDQVLAGAGKHLDAVSFHYSDGSPTAGDNWRNVMKKHGLNLPMWNTEERAEVPLRNIAGGIEKTFKFIHTEIGYPEYRPLAKTDFTLQPSGVWYSVGAHCIGDARFVKTQKQEWCEAYFFERKGEAIAVFGGGLGSKKLLRALPSVTVRAQPLEAGKPLVVTDMWGRSRQTKLSDGLAEIELDSPAIYVNGAKSIEMVKVGVSSKAQGALVFEAERGKWSKGWTVKERDASSEGKTVGLWVEEDGDHWIELQVAVPKAGRYEVLFAGYPLVGVAKPPSISPFAWSFDGGPEHHATGSEKTTFDASGEIEGVSEIGTVDLKEGQHTFRIRLTGRRVLYDNRYGMWLDAIALRAVK